MNKEYMFKPTFGNKPPQIIGRDKVIENFYDGLEGGPGHPERAIFLIGQRGMGKTALLLEFAERAATMDFIAVRVTAGERMLDEILQIIQTNGEKFVRKRKKDVKSISAGAFGFSVGLNFTEETVQNYGFRIKFTMLVDEISKCGKGILLLIDEVTGAVPEMRELAITYQHLVGENKNIAVTMAGLPEAISAVLNDDVLTFLNRARKVALDPISLSDIKIYYMECFNELEIKISRNRLEKAVNATRGYPYLFQLIGYYLVKYAGINKSVDDDILSMAIESSKQDLIDNIYKPCLRGLSEKDIEFLKIMSENDGDSTTIDIMKRMGVTQSYAQQYRKRLIEAGVVSSEKRGHLTITIPFLSEYLFKNDF